MDVGGVVEEVDHLGESLNKSLLILVSCFAFLRVGGCQREW